MRRLAKPITSTILAFLVSLGIIDWDDPVNDLDPDFRLFDALASRDLTLRDLLCHRSGLGTFSGDLLWWGTPYSPEEVLRRTRHLPAKGRFRSDYGYSNLMFLAAGEVIRSASGQPWSDFVQQRILTRLPPCWPINHSPPATPLRLTPPSARYPGRGGRWWC